MYTRKEAEAPQANLNKESISEKLVSFRPSWRIKRQLIIMEYHLANECEQLSNNKLKRRLNSNQSNNKQLPKPLCFPQTQQGNL